MGLIRNAICTLGWCGTEPRSDAVHVWEECPRCGRMANLVSREGIRRHAEAQERDRKFLRERETLKRSVAARAVAR
jgi:hypothetical protein